ncbi:hypothetical protein [Vibrio furnissii]|uniref:Uncharacterized protein n=1 Tax=Vibrio furnissii TaxID=29494 RepID=A0A0Q2MXF1_VIBFU|nr:hypothetical protein [Vibrio furnissii]KQH84327.1 hypothetical protein AMR76_19055 [Vibrio furnissii]MCG6234871.1 hypothetical protein [Vibrio furnissii]MCG6258086.1 hypothetical protein [Vibrio furnissii]WHR52116.1 hypothetical protein O8413_04250 [Vibrio furnissii]
MKTIDENKLDYRGETNGIHQWNAPSGQPYYWHPDWLHIAEDTTGQKAPTPLDIKPGQTATKQHAIAAILKHINQWAANQFTKHGDIETQAHESEFNLKR